MKEYKLFSRRDIDYCPLVVVPAMAVCVDRVVDSTDRKWVTVFETAVKTVVVGETLVVCSGTGTCVVVLAKAVVDAAFGKFVDANPDLDVPFLSML